MAIRSRIVGCGSYLPSRVVTNAELSTRVDTSDEWIVQRTGIRQRHVAAEGELTSDLAIAAARRALESAGAKPEALDLIVLATTTPDHTFPATATKVQAALGMAAGAAFDVQAVCAGFIFALAVADNFVRLGQARSALVIGAETFSRLLDWHDRATCVLFGDGAGAVLLQADGSGARDARGILSTHLHTDGRTYDLLYVDGGPSSTGTVGKVRMDGQGVFRHAVAKLAATVDEVPSNVPSPDQRAVPITLRTGLRRPTSTGWCRTRPTSASSTAWRASSGWGRSAWCRPWPAMPTPRPRRSPWRSPKPPPTAG